LDIRETIRFWSNLQVLQICGDTIVSLETTTKERMVVLETGYSLNDETKVTEKDWNAVIEMIWPMVKGMLTNLGCLECAAIHRTLKMFANESFQYALSVEELSEVLEVMMHQDKLDFDGSKYSIKKD
jgi:hypothetical protein